MANLLTPHVTARPHEPAVVDDRGSLTWAELNDRVNRLISALRARGLAEGDRIAVIAGNQRETIEVGLACMHGGWIMVPVNWHWVAPELAYVLSDCDAAALIAGQQWTQVAVDALELDAARSTGPAVRIAVGAASDRSSGFDDYDEVLASGSAEEPIEPTRGGPMFYTSGTTGHPKGVRGVLAETGGGTEMWQLIGASIAQTLEVAAEQPVQLVCGPAYHSAQWVNAMAPLLVGATIVLQHRFDAADLLRLIDEYRVTNVHLVPAQMVRLLRLDDATRDTFDGSSLRAVFHGAAPCPESVKRALIDWWGPIITEYYGGTEGGFISTISASEWLERPGSVGRPTSVIEVLVVGPDGQQLPAGEIGDLYFRSLLGSDFRYHNAPEKTAAAHLEAGVATLGDIGSLDEDGYLFLSDRRIDMIISGGVNIYPAEIESVLAAHDAVNDVAVFGIPDDDMGERVMAVVELAAAHRADAESDLAAITAQLVEHCRTQLAGYKCPREWTFSDGLPRNEVGKLAKRTLRDPYWTGEARTM